MPNTYLDQPPVFRGAEQEEIPTSAALTAQTRRQSTDESFDLSHDPNMESRTGVRREGGEGRELQLVIAGPVESNSDNDVS